MDFLRNFLATDLGKVLSSGAVVNFFLVIIGSLLGLLFKKGIPERIRQTLMTGMAFCVLYIGITGLFEAQANILVMIVCMALGSIIGEVIDLDKRVNNLGLRIENSFKKKDSNTKIAEGFVNASILFCTGAMAIVGSIQDGILADHTTLFAKGTLDGIISLILAANLGIGVLFSAVSVGIYQGSITALAGVVEPFVTPQILAEVTASGGVMIMAIGTNMLNVTKIRIANLLPGMIPAAILAMYF